ncbi:MAG: hypothetical protein HKN83_04400 [Gammaproteobacteria bacterium]|nr:hypothetical protein [Gammaproteobacteria bacterium]
MTSNYIHKQLIRHTLLSLWFLFVMANSANAADMAGRYLVSGVGKDSCRSFVDADGVGKSYYRTWLSGYITSHNYNSEETYSVVNKKTVDELEAWLRGYCFSNTTHTYEQAVKNLMRKLEYFKKKNFYDK